MPKQSSDIFVPGGTAIEFSKSGQKWTIEKGVEVGAVGTTIFSEFADSTLVNKGYIYSYAVYGAWFTGNNTTLVNKETGLINGSQFGVLISPNLATDIEGSVENYGKIFGGSAGIHNTAMPDFTVDNHGEINGYAYGVHSLALNVGSTPGQVIKNFDSIKSDIYGIYVTSLASLRSKVVNQKDGVIEGGKIVDGGAAVFNGSGGLNLINKGKIKGDIWSPSSADNTVTNTGKIEGGVRLGSGDDELDNIDGRVTGYIWGADGKDKLIAGDKKEKFVFDDLTDFDRVKNFESGKDKFFLDQAAFGTIGLGPLAKSAFRKGTEAEDADDRVIYHKDSGKLYVDDDGVDGNGPVQFAKVDPGQKLKYSDFTVEVFA
ncbi:hypothetical protein [Bauldia sp.]|uniref:hypothetical protein n=1 Tax=Bauldia sp. TaxID=2575872 RepID=UPI003BABF2FC